jgi:hypothetical protein
MLSPNARNFVFEIFGVIVTVILKLQEAWRDSASVAVHVMVVDPAGYPAAWAPVQLTVTGGWPFTGVGSANGKGTRAPSGETSETEAGHVSDGASGVGGGVGLVGDEQAPSAIRHRTTMGCRRRCSI